MVKGQENLIPFDERSEDEARELGKKGGIKSGEVRRRKRDLREIAQHLISIALAAGDSVDLEDIKSLQQVPGENLTVGQAMVLKQIELAMKGDTAAFKAINSVLGDPATNKRVAAETERTKAQTEKIQSEIAEGDQESLQKVTEMLEGFDKEAIEDAEDDA